MDQGPGSQLLRWAMSALLVFCTSTSALSQVCGDANSDGNVVGADIYYLASYLYDGGPAPLGPADVDDYQLHTARDITCIAWNLVVGAPALICPPTNPKLVPTYDSTTLVVYDAVLPAGASSMVVRIRIKAADSVAVASLPLQIRVAGQIPSISSVTHDPSTIGFGIRKAVVNTQAGTVLLSYASFSPETSLPPGVHLLATVTLFMSPSGQDRPLQITWTQFPPVEAGLFVNYPMLVRNDLSAVEPALVTDCVADTDEDGVVDCQDLCPGFDDALDADLDGKADGCELCPGFDDFADADGDLVPDGCDLCAGYDDSSDVDSDGTPDCQDPCTDTDHDGFGNPGFVFNTCPVDKCPNIYDPFQDDTDLDGVGDPCDNCRTTPNAVQTDADGDFAGDACDNCPGVVNPTQGDFNEDGLGNACDPFTPQLHEVTTWWVSDWGAGCWGYTAPDGSEYALYGGAYGVGVFRTAPVMSYIAELPHSPSYWREIKTYKNYVYAVTENGGSQGGLLVADLSPLPNPPVVMGYFAINGGSAMTSHNLSIDTVRGYAYLEGETGTHSIYIHNLADPAAPAYVGTMGSIARGIHDMYAENNLLYVAEGTGSAWSIWNVTNKSNPVMRVRVVSPSNGYMHNIWPTPDGNYCVTTEETAGRTVKFWDISDYQNIQLVGEYLGPSGLAHNAHVKGDLVFLSHYESGVAVVSIADRMNPRELAIYDTYPWGEGPNFWGSWGMFPYTKNGMIYSSNMDGTLSVFTLTASAVCPITLTGDANHSGLITVADIIYLVAYVMQGGAAPLPCAAGGDVDCSGAVTLADVIGLVNYVFKGAAPPCDACTMTPGAWSCP